MTNISYIPEECRSPHQQALFEASDFIADNSFIGFWTDPADGVEYALYGLNYDGASCSVGAHYGMEPHEYLSGMVTGFDTYAEHPALLHAIIECWRNGWLD